VSNLFLETRFIFFTLYILLIENPKLAVVHELKKKMQEKTAIVRKQIG